MTCSATGCRYTPDQDFHGGDSFTYRPGDQGRRPTTAGSGLLARTGSDVGALVSLSALLVAAGLVVLRSRRRLRAGHPPQA